MDEGIRARLERRAKPKDGQERTFALIWVGILGFLAWRWKSAPCAAAGGVVLLLALARPSLFAPVLRQWMRLAGVLAKVNTAVILFLMYYLVFTPYGWLQRLFAGDAMDERLRTGDSYWKKKEPNSGLEAYERQF